MTEVHFYKTDLQANTFTPSYNATMTIHQDGRITLNENAQPTEAAAACIDAMRHIIQDMIRNAVEAEKKQLTRENGYLLKEQALAYIAQNERLRKELDAIVDKPDPLVEVIKDLSWDETTVADEWAADLRAAIEKRGGKIVWGEG